jgi:hypothetical protein
MAGYRTISVHSKPARPQSLLRLGPFFNNRGWQTWTVALKLRVRLSAASMISIFAALAVRGGTKNEWACTFGDRRHSRAAGPKRISQPHRAWIAWFVEGCAGLYRARRRGGYRTAPRPGNRPSASLAVRSREMDRRSLTRAYRYCQRERRTHFRMRSPG